MSKLLNKITFAGFSNLEAFVVEVAESVPGADVALGLVEELRVLFHQVDLGEVSEEEVLRDPADAGAAVQGAPVARSGV